MKLVYEWFVLILLAIKCLSIEGKVFHVSDYGAYPNDNFDDTNGIQSAISAAINYGVGTEIDFGYGIYTISTTIAILNATDLTVKGQGIDQTFIIGQMQEPIFTIGFCQGLNLTSFSIDYDPLPFTAGYVVNINDKYLDIQVVPPHQTDVNQQVQAILRYDPIQMRPAFGPNTYEIYQQPPTDANTTIVSPGILRVPLSQPTQFGKGEPVVVRYLMTQHAISAYNSIDLMIQSINVYASWSMGFVTVSVKRLNVINFNVLQRNGRWMSANQDCMHFIDTREYVSISNSKCQGMGDDGLNVCARFFLVSQVIDSSTIIMEAFKGGPLDVGIGTNLEITSHEQPFTIHGNGTISSLTFVSDNSRKVTFTSPVNVNLNDWVSVADTPLLTIRNFTVSHNRARGALLETRNIDIRQSVFNRTSGPAILIQPSLYWYEGPGARNISLIENIYIENNEGLAGEKGIITILPDPIQSVPVFNDIQIESSTFYFGNYSQALIQTDNANNLFLAGNYIATNNSIPLISICNSRNISATNNCVVNQLTKIDTYYTFDQDHPCSMNLSSLIDLPPSAFNASFSPPVL